MPYRDGRRGSHDGQRGRRGKRWKGGTVDRRTWMLGIGAALGLAGLSFYVPAGQLLEKGLYPFLIGDLAKSENFDYLQWKFGYHLG